MTTLLITGKTYPVRREIRRLGGRWNQQESGWTCPLEKREEVAALSHDIKIIEFEAPDNCFAPITLEQKREILQERRNRKAKRLLEAAERRDREAGVLRSQTRPYMSDIAFTTQPITQNSGGRSFQRFREKINGKVEKEFGLMNEAENLREKAQSLMAPVQMKGDAEKRRIAAREAMDKIVKVGSKVIYRLFSNGECTVVKVNKKTYTVEFADKRKFAVEKTFVSLVK